MEASLAERAVSIARKQLDAGIKYRQPRFDEIAKIEDLSFGKIDPALPGRFNVPLPIMEGYIQTLLSKIDNPPHLEYMPARGQDLLRAKKVSSAWQSDSAPDKGNWAQTDLDVKKLAIISGRGIFKIYTESDPEYKSHLEPVDYYDFVCEPSGGNRLENHLFVAQMNIFKTERQLKTGGLYDKGQVRKLIVSNLDKDTKRDNETIFINKTRRLNALGLDPLLNNYVGDSIYNLTEQVLSIDGVRYYLLWDYRTGIWVRFEKLVDVFESNLYPWTSWATDVEPFNFWSRGPCDLVRPAAEAIRIVYNQTLDNIQKRNWEMKAYDKNMVNNPSQLKYRPDGLVEFNVQEGQSIQGGLRLLETADTTSNTLSLINFTRGLLGAETGVTDAAKGVSDQDKVGINDSDLQQVADRLGLTNKLYSQAWTELGLRYSWGLYEHMPNKMMVKMIGVKGIEWEELKREDVEPDYEIRVVGSSVDQQMNKAKRDRRSAALDRLVASNLVSVLNPKVLAEEILRDGEFEEHQVKSLLSQDMLGNDEMTARAEQAIDAILNGKKAKKYRGATTWFVQYILDYATDNVLDKNPEKDLEMFNKLAEYANAHLEIAMENQARGVAKKMAEEQNLAMSVPAEETLPTEENLEPVNTIQDEPVIA